LAPPRGRPDGAPRIAAASLAAPSVDSVLIVLSLLLELHAARGGASLVLKMDTVDSRA
jgi:hypothetical protein